MKRRMYQYVLWWPLPDLCPNDGWFALRAAVMLDKWTAANKTMWQWWKD